MCVCTYVWVLCVSVCKWLCACASVHVVVTVVNCPSSNHTMLCDCLLLELTACCTDHAGPTSHGTLWLLSASQGKVIHFQRARGYRGDSKAPPPGWHHCAASDDQEWCLHPAQLHRQVCVTSPFQDCRRTWGGGEGQRGEELSTAAEDEKVVCVCMWVCVCVCVSVCVSCVLLVQ